MVERAELVRLVAAHHPTDQREQQSQRRFLAELDRLERPWDQEADLVHVTASAVVVGARGTVLHRHRLLGAWLQPGGHLETGEHPAEAARREATEETGLDGRHPESGPRLLRLDVHQAARGHVHLDLCYLLAASDLDPVPGPGESPDARWWDWEEAMAVADEPLRGALHAARSLAVGA